MRWLWACVLICCLLVACGDDGLSKSDAKEIILKQHDIEDLTITKIESCPTTQTGGISERWLVSATYSLHDFSGSDKFVDNVHFLLQKKGAGWDVHIRSNCSGLD